MGQHDPQCICELCTCGRHQCPFDRSKSNNASAISFETGTTEGAGGGKHFYRKEFVTVADGMERTKATKPKGELERTAFSVTEGDSSSRYHHRGADNELRPALLADARNERFLTSAALRKRTQKSQIELGGGGRAESGEGGQQAAAAGMKSTYREESERALQNGTSGGLARTRAAPRVASGRAAAELLGGSGKPDETPKSSIHRTDYAAKRTERAQPTRPKTSDLWKREGAIEGTTVTREQFADKRAQAQRVESFRPQENGSFLSEPGADRSFQRESSTLSDYGPKKGERAEAHRPPDSGMFKSGEPLHERTTVNRSEYGHAGHGERFERRVPPEETAELFRGDGSFLGESSKSAEFQPKKGDRFEAKVQRSSDFWKNEGKMAGQSVNRESYAHLGATERRPEPKRPQESGILKGDGKFTTETHKHVEFGPKQGARAEAIRPTDSDLFKSEGHIGLDGTVNRSDYAHTYGERANVPMPHRGASSVVLGAPEGTEFAKKTVSQEEFVAKQQSDPAQLHRPMQNLRLEGAQPTFDSVTREDFAEKQLDAGQQQQRQRGRANEASSFSLMGASDGARTDWVNRSMTQEEFAPKELDERVRPVVHRSELSILDPGATFHSGTMYSEQFQQVSPDSYGGRHAIRPSTALKLEGNRELTSGYHMEYTNKIMPCPAGELVQSVKSDHAPTKNFEFHSVNKGHHLYRSRENLAAANE